MSLASAVVLLMAVFAGIFAWVTVLFLLPGLAQSLYRHRLWTIHDEIVDDLIDERLKPTQRVKFLLAGVDRHVRRAPHISMSDALVMTLALGKRIHVNS